MDLAIPGWLGGCSVKPRRPAYLGPAGILLIPLGVYILFTVARASPRRDTVGRSIRLTKFIQ